MVKYMEKNKLILWNVIFVTSLVIANVVAGKVVLLFGVFVVPSAVIAYAFTFLATDVIDEMWGKEEANQTVKMGFIAQIFASFLILGAMYLPVAPFAKETQTAFMTLLGQNWRFVIASLTAYLVSQHFDVWIFNVLKKKYCQKWIRNNLSTILSQLVDTSIFITIAFIGGVPSLFTMIVSQFFIKFILALIDTPIFYLVTKEN